MTKIEMTEVIMAAKAAKQLTWAAIAEASEMSEVFVTSCCLGMNSMPADAADKLCAFLELDSSTSTALQAKELIHEKFGDGIMSAIDFVLSVEKEENPKGDRVVVTMNGKFLPYNQW